MRRMEEESRRMREIADRLTEMEYGLAGLRARNDRALHYLRRELEGMARECRDSRDGWAEATRRAESLLAAIHGDLNDAAPGDQADDDQGNDDS